MYKDFIPFSCWMIFHCMEIAHFAYRFISWWGFGLFPLFDYCEWCCCEHSCAGVLWTCFQFCWFCTPEWIAGSCGNLVWHFEELSNSFQKCLHLPFYIPTRSVEGLPPFCSPQARCFSGLGWEQPEAPGIPWALYLDKWAIFHYFSVHPGSLYSVYQALCWV